MLFIRHLLLTLSFSYISYLNCCVWNTNISLKIPQWSTNSLSKLIGHKQYHNPRVMTMISLTNLNVQEWKFSHIPIYFTSLAPTKIRYILMNLMITYSTFHPLTYTTPARFLKVLKGVHDTNIWEYQYRVELMQS